MTFSTVPKSLQGTSISELSGGGNNTATTSFVNSDYIFPFILIQSGTAAIAGGGDGLLAGAVWVVSVGGVFAVAGGVAFAFARESAGAAFCNLRRESRRKESRTARRTCRMESRRSESRCERWWIALSCRIV